MESGNNSSALDINYKFKIVVLISGSGSNLQSIMNAIGSGEIPASIVAVISNRTDAFGLERARQEGVSTEILEHGNFDTREAFDTELAALIDHYQPDLVVLAGFMRILTPQFVSRYLGKLINIHPSLLPLYPGLNTHQRALDAGDTKHGASVHFVIPELDAGPVILQGWVNIKTGDTPQSLAANLLARVEHKIYPTAIKWIAQERIRYSNGIVYKDQEPLPLHGDKIEYNDYQS